MHLPQSHSYRWFSYFLWSMSFLFMPAVLWAADPPPPPAPVVTDSGASTSAPYQLTVTVSVQDPESGIMNINFLIMEGAVNGTFVVQQTPTFMGWTGTGTFTLSGLPLQNGKTYYIIGRAENGVRLWSANGNSNGILYLGPSADVTQPVVTIPQPVNGGTIPASGVTAQGGATDNVAVSQVNVNVFDVTTGAYTLGSAPASFNASTGTWTYAVPASALVAGHQVQLQAYAFDTSNNSSATATATVTVQSAAADTTPPTTPVVTDDGQYTTSSTTLHASWSSADPESGIAQYLYQIRQDSTVGTLIVDWTSTSTTTSVTRTGLTLQQGKTYFFGVQAKNGAGLLSTAGFSNGIKVDTTAPSAPGTPTEGSTTDLDYDGDGAYTVYWPAATDAESGIVTYELQERVGTTGIWTSLTNTSTATFFSVTGRLHNTQYFYQVRAKNGAGLIGAFSAVSDGMKVDTTAPGAPGQPTEGSPDQDYDRDGAYTIYWTAASDAESGIASYELQERVGTTGAWKTLSSTIAGTSYSVSGRLNGNAYYYQIRAKNRAGLPGPFSTVSDGMTVDTQAPQVSAIGATNITSAGAALNWTTNEVASCTVQCGTASPPTTPCATTSSGTSHVASLTGLSGDTTYYVGVACTDLAGNISATSSTSFKTQPVTVPSSPSIGTINGRQLLLQRRNPDGTLAPAVPYSIRGVNWSPASRGTATSPADPNNANVRRPEFGKWYQTDIPLMKAMNVNTIRTFIDLGFDSTLGPTGRTILDECYRNGIMVIMTVDDAINNTSRAQQVVNFYKNHPAILAWSLGSEWNINLYFGVASSVSDAAQRTQMAAALIKSLDPNHPVISSYGEIDFGGPDTQLAATQQYVNTTCPSVGIWSLNLYRGDTFGALWTQWSSITTKPMFLGEFGVDAFDIRINPPTGAVNEAAQVQWDVSLWNDLARNLSAKDPNKAALGGTVFEWNDEWWKVIPPGSQETGGWISDGFPDGKGNEEYFGIVDIDRRTRQVYGTLTPLFDPAYVPPPASSTVTFKAVSRGAAAEEYAFQYGVAKFYKSFTLLYSRTGGAGGGRGFNVAAVSTITGDLLQPVQHFDTYASGPDMTAMINLVNSLPNGTLVMLAVADEAGLNTIAAGSCTPRSYVEPAFQMLETLGSRQIRNYCYRDSWAMVAVKGEGQARQEQLGKGVEATAQTTVTLP